jgi:Protein of unknown function (DUF1778)
MISTRHPQVKREDLTVGIFWLYIGLMADRPRKHTEAIVLRFEPEQLELVDQAAELAGLSRTSWLRALAIRAARQELAESGDKAKAKRRS